MPKAPTSTACSVAASARDLSVWVSGTEDLQNDVLREAQETVPASATGGPVGNGGHRILLLL